MRISAATDKGKKRENNEDSFDFGRLPDGAWAVVCDGMGGYNAGEVASKIACDTMSAIFKDAYITDMNPKSLRSLLVMGTENANREVLYMGEKKAEYSGMGTTLVAAISTKRATFAVHVGDSRCYHMARDGLKLVTADHSYVKALVDMGMITTDKAANHPKKNAITRAVGFKDDIEPELDEIDFREGDMLLLCTDGLTNSLSYEQIEKILADGFYDDIAKRLVDEANRIGGQDNITAVVIQS